MKRFSGFFLILISAGLLLSTFSCTSAARITITDKPVYKLNVSFVPGSILENAMSNFADPEHKEASLFDVKMLKKTFAESDVTLTDVKLIGMSGIDFTCTIPQNHPVFQKMIRYNREKKHTRIQMNSEIITNVLVLIPEESRDFIDMLAAPLFTGEELTTAEYEETIAAIYGKKLAEALKKSVFTLEIDCPYKIKKSSISPVGKISGKKPMHRRIEIPLTELLCTRDTIIADLTGK